MYIAVLIERYAITWAAAAIVALVVLGLASLIIFRRRPSWRVVAWAALIGYILIVLNVTLISRPSIFFEAIELNPLASIRRAQNARAELAAIEIRNMILNFAMFVPIGALAHLVSTRQRVLKTIAISAALSLSIEATQYITNRGVLSTEDLILNTLGAALGCLLIKLLQKIFKKP